jgi:hypothetical protein
LAAAARLGYQEPDANRRRRPLEPVLPLLLLLAPLPVRLLLQSSSFWLFSGAVVSVKKRPRIP